MTKRPARIYFSLRSPFSWIAVRLLDELLTPDERASCEYLPYWEPDQQTLQALRERDAKFLYTQMTREKHLYILHDIKRMTKSLGYEHVWPIDSDPWWELPNLAYLVAVRHGKGEAFRALAYRARWQQGENIHVVETIKRLADLLQLDPEELAGAPQDPEIRAQAADILARAYHDGVFGVPFFICGHEKFWGVDRLHAFVSALKGRAHPYLTPKGAGEAAMGVAAYDNDAAGGCG